MLVIHDAFAATDLPRGGIVTIGNYDGVHRGQRSVLDLVAERARVAGLHSMVVTFEPHPLTVLRPEEVPPRLTTLEQKEKLLEKSGVDVMLVVRFTPGFAETTAEEFVRDFLHTRLDAREIYVGANFMFGRGRRGNVALLNQMGEELGFQAVAMEEVLAHGEPISSTRIRRAILEGETLLALELLGRPHSLSGVVVRGDRMGQRLGWPTINLSPDHGLTPADGVYATQVHFPSITSTFDSVTNVGTRPTVYENYQRVVESHILDFANNVYGEAVELRFFKRLRDEKIFSSTMDLSAQIGRDVEASREYFRRRQRLESCP